jgi:hypothetical protein
VVLNWEKVPVPLLIRVKKLPLEVLMTRSGAPSPLMSPTTISPQQLPDRAVSVSECHVDETVALAGAG